MPIYVKDGGDWRILDTSGDGPDQLYVETLQVLLTNLSLMVTFKRVVDGYV